MILSRTPEFWWNGEPTWQARALAPAGAFYGEVTARRMARGGQAVGRPVICIGNFVAGGAGKTPLAITLAERLVARRLAPGFLSRGYGRRTAGKGVVAVDPLRHDAAVVGDEPLLLARRAPTFVGKDRIAAARQAIEAGATVLVLDDGLQSPALVKDASIAVVDGATGAGNGLCVPAGPLRAPLSRQWAFVSAVCLIGRGRAGEVVADEARSRGIPVLAAVLQPDARVLEALAGRPVFAFAGIGRPAKFFATLESAGLDVVARRGFADHHPYTGADQDRLRRDAERLGAMLVTTEKDQVRLTADFPATALPVILALEDNAPLDALIDGVLRPLRSRA